MNEFLLILSTQDGFQFVENSRSELTLEYIEYIILYFGLSLAMIVMMLIPVVLFFSMVLSFISMKDNYRKLYRAFNFKGNNENSEYLKSLRTKYIRSYSSFFKYFSAITTWNIFSLLYIIIAFDNFIIGLREYFFFPLNVFQTLNESEIYDTVYVFQTESLTMTAIIVLTFIFYNIGAYFGVSIAKNKIDSTKNKISITKNKIREEDLELAVN